MKASRIELPIWGVVLLVGALGTSSGCRSGASWKSPTSWFASRDPNPSLLAGRTEAQQQPISPSQKYTPTALANSTPGSAPKPSSPAPAYGTPQNSSIVKGTQPAPTSGLAAQANGYQTGPYGMSTTPAVGAASQTAQNSSPASSFPNPYGGTYAGVTSSPATAANVSLPTNSKPSGLAAGTVANSTQSVPGYPALPSSPTAMGQTTTVSGPNSTPGSLASLPYPSVNAQASAAAPPATASNLTPPASAYQPVAPAGAYAPGTTSRNTSYNFGAGAPTGSSGAVQYPSMGLPPNTATGGSQLLR